MNLAQNITTKILYNEKTLLGRLHQYFLIYFETFSVPTADTLFLLILSILQGNQIYLAHTNFLIPVFARTDNIFFSFYKSSNKQYL